MNKTASPSLFAIGCSPFDDRTLLPMPDTLAAPLTPPPTDQALSALPHMGGLDDSPRGRVLRAAAYLFHQQGFARTTVRELAQVVGIQSGSLFHHFKTKEAILIAVMEEAILYNTQRMTEAVRTGKTPKQQLHQLIRAELESINSDTGAAMAVLVFEWDALTTAQQAPLLNMRDDYEALWLGVLRQAHQEGLIGQPPFIWRRLIGGAISWTVTWYNPAGTVSLDELAAMLLEMGLKGS
jgi:AcrR family transcriptional regulator